jgi:hypothetical protein
LQRCIFAEGEVTLPRGMIVLATMGGHRTWENGIAVPGWTAIVRREHEGGWVMIWRIIGDLGQGTVDRRER